MILVFGTNQNEDPDGPGWQVSLATPAWEQHGPEPSRFERLAGRFRRHPVGVRRR
jgi:hypothetical protein